MKGLAITHLGIEEISALEIKELISAHTEVQEGAVIFDAQKPEDFCVLCYKAQSVKKILYLIDSFEITDVFNQLKKKIDEIDFKAWFDTETTFRVSSEIIDSDLLSEEVNKTTGEYILDALQAKSGFTPKVNLESSDVIFYVYIFGKSCYIGIDVSGKDLSKREYKIFSSRESIKGTIAYALLRLGDYSEKELILDPFCKSGEIVIEASLYATGFPVNFYARENFAFYKLKTFSGIDVKKLFQDIDKKASKQSPKIYGYDTEQKYIMQAKKNAKIAGAQKYIIFSRQNLEWIDLKQEEKKVDKIVSYPPQESKNAPQKEVAKMYHELFYQAEYILTDKGLVVMLSKSLDLLKLNAEKFKFFLKETREIRMGEQKMLVGIFTKEKKT